MKTGSSREGGTVRGLFTAGIIDVMMEAGISFDGRKRFLIVGENTDVHSHRSACIKLSSLMPYIGSSFSPPEPLR